MKFLYKNISSALRLLILLSLTILLMEGSVKAQPLPPDVGIVTQLSGEATYWNEGYQKTPEKVQVFMKIRLGDYFKIAAGGTIQLVYFQNGRQETWKGPVAITVSEVQSRVEGEKGLPGQPEVVILPVETSQGMRRIPVLLRRDLVVQVALCYAVRPRLPRNPLFLLRKNGLKLTWRKRLTRNYVSRQNRMTSRLS